MIANRNSEGHCRMPRRAAVAISIVLAICSSAGCTSKKRVEYVNGDHKLTRLKQGEAAPRSGILISEGYLSEIYVALGKPKPGAEILDSKTAPAAPATLSLTATPATK